MAILHDLSAARNSLGLDLAVLQSRAGFYRAYARRNLERGRARAGVDPIWERLANPADPWLGPAMIASSYRTAAQYAELFDTMLAVDLMLRASRGLSGRRSCIRAVPGGRGDERRRAAPGGRPAGSALPEPPGYWYSVRVVDR